MRLWGRTSRTLRWSHQATNMWCRMRTWWCSVEWFRDRSSPWTNTSIAAAALRSSKKAGPSRNMSQCPGDSHGFTIQNLNNGGSKFQDFEFGLGVSDVSGILAQHDLLISVAPADLRCLFQSQNFWRWGRLLHLDGHHQAEAAHRHCRAVPEGAEVRERSDTESGPETWRDILRPLVAIMVNGYMIIW